jgi:predicted SnoaL-like aldol condensation-catalyzing enzyme
MDPLDTSDRARLSPREVSDRFLEVFYRQNRLVEAFEAWVHPDYIQHDPNSATGRDGTIEALDAHMKRSPGMSHDVKRVIYGEPDGDGTLVVVHYHFRHAPEDLGMAVVDIFRIKHGYLIEHWDIMQFIPDPAEAKNSNSMF